MNVATDFDFIGMIVFLLIAVAAFGYVWLDTRRNRVERELDRQQEDVLRLAVQLADQMRTAGFDARRTLIRAAHEANKRQQ